MQSFWPMRCAALLLVGLEIGAQSTGEFGQLRVEVVEIVGPGNKAAPLSGAWVVAEYEDQKEVRVTDKLGVVNFTSLLSGKRITVQALKAGYAPQDVKSPVKTALASVNATVNLAPPPDFLVMRKTPRASRVPPSRMIIVLARYERQGDFRRARSTSAAVCSTVQVVFHGQPLPGARVALLAVSGEDLTSVGGPGETGKDGRYKYPNSVPDGSLLVVSKQGFESWLQVIEDRPPCTVTLEAEKQTADPVPLSGTASEEISEPARRSLYAGSIIRSLPVPGFRAFDHLALLAPGVFPAPASSNPPGPGLGPTVGSAGQFSVNGLRSRENNFTVDGSDNNDEDLGVRRQGFVAPATQSIESIGEFQIISLDADATFGRNMGGQVAAVSLHGGTALHGDFYGFSASHRFAARNTFDSRIAGSLPAYSIDGVPQSSGSFAGKPPVTRTQSGMNLGGPLSRRNRLFFHIAYEHLHEQKTSQFHFNVPTIAQRGLNDSGATGFIATVFGRRVPLYPATLTGDAIYSLYPFPNDAGGPYGANTYTSLLSSPARADLGSAKLDYHRVEGRIRHSLVGRFSETREHSALPVTGGALRSALRPEFGSRNLIGFWSASSHRFSNTFRVSLGTTDAEIGGRDQPGWLRSDRFPQDQLLLNAPLLINVSLPGQPGTRYLSAASPEFRGLFQSAGAAPSTPNTESITGPLGQVIVSGFSGVGVDGFRFPMERNHRTDQFIDTATLQTTSHRLSWGFDLRRALLDSVTARAARPIVIYQGSHLSDPPLVAGQSYREILGDWVSPATMAAAGPPSALFTTLANSTDPSLSLHKTQADFFFDDAWRVSGRLQLQFGLRSIWSGLPGDDQGRFLRDYDRATLEAEVLRVRSEPPCARGPCAILLNRLLRAFPATYEETFGADPFTVDWRAGGVLRLRADGTTRLRVAFGRFTGQFPAIILNEARTTFPRFLPLNTAANSTLNRLFNLAGDPRIVVPGTLNELPSAASASGKISSAVEALGLALNLVNGLGLSLNHPGAGLAGPYSLQYHVAVERSFGESWFASAGYAGTRGRRLLTQATPDLGPMYPDLVANGQTNNFNIGGSFPYDVGSGRAIAAQGLGGFLAVSRTILQGSGRSSFHSLQAEIRRLYRGGIIAGFVWTYSHALDDSSDFFDTAGSYALPQNSLIPSEWGNSSYDVRFRQVSHFLWDVPAAGRSRWLRGWQLAGIETWQTGQPFTVNTVYDINRDGNPTDRLDTTEGLLRLNGGRLSLAPGTRPFSLLAGTSASGRVGRNTFRGPGLANIDLSVRKRFEAARGTIDVRAEVFNVTNHSNFAIPVRILESAGFGQPTQLSSPNRLVQFTLRYSF